MTAPTRSGGLDITASVIVRGCKRLTDDRLEEMLRELGTVVVPEGSEERVWVRIQAQSQLGRTA